MAETSAYCSHCSNMAVKSPSPQGHQLLAAENSGSVPMTKEGACNKCGQPTVVLSFEICPPQDLPPHALIPVPRVPLGSLPNHRGVPNRGQVGFVLVCGTVRECRLITSTRSARV